MSAATFAPAPSVVWCPCPMCWGQGRIFEDRNGEGIVPSSCDACLGLGERLLAEMR
jgi:DnaJ-class molecular chaperone